MNTVQIKVAESIANLGPKVEDKVVDAIVDRELKKRSEAMVITVDKLEKLEADLKKVKPDQNSFDEDGKPMSSSWSKKALEEKNKLTQKIEKFNKAITKALETGDFQDVYNIEKQGGDNQGKSEEEVG